MTEQELGFSPQKFMAAASAPAPLSGNTDWAHRYAETVRQVVKRHAATHGRSQQRHLGPSEIGHVCLHGDTEVVTRQGIRRIRDLAKEGRAELLVPLQYEGSDVRKKWGKFVEVPVEYFGDQELYEITLRRNQDRKVVFATAEHGWFRSYYSGKQKKQERLETHELRPGHRLTQLRRARPKTTTLMPVAVAQGFVFGDGTSGSNDDRHRPARLDLHHNGKDEALLKYFPDEYFPGGRRLVTDPRKAHPFSEIKSLPRFWKRLPPVDESTSFLLSWLAGYFAADGSVGEDGHCTISSAYEQNLRFVQAAAAICGVGYGLVRRYMRRGISGYQPAQEESAIYYLSLRRADLPDWFFLTAKHAERAQRASLAPERDPHWVVESVKPTGRTEPVYCAVTGDVGAFALADDLMTGNCHRQVVGKLIGLPRTNHVLDPWPSILGIAAHAWLEVAFRDENGRLGYLRWVPEQKVEPFPGDTPFDTHRGTADLYDAVEQCVGDHKVLGPTSLAKVRSDNVPRYYVVQALLYKRGYERLGLPVRRVALIAYPRAAASLDQLYVWERPASPADDELIDEVVGELAYRKQWAAAILAGQANWHDVPEDTADECGFCPFYRPQAAHDGGPGCPGHAAGRP